jgi:signal transduction histidine kinase
VRLRQGSADEAKALVDRALQLVKSRGLAAASGTLHDKASGFVDRDLYIFVVDRQGTYRLHGAKPAMEGKRVHEVPGINGDKFVRDAWAAAPGAGGWIDYDIVNPETGGVMPKASFVVQLDEQQLIGCGVYRQTGQAAFAKAA